MLPTLLSKTKKSHNLESSIESRNDTSSNLKETDDDLVLENLFGLIKLDKFKTLKEIAESDYL